MREGAGTERKLQTSLWVDKIHCTAGIWGTEEGRGRLLDRARFGGLGVTDDPTNARVESWGRGQVLRRRTGA